MAYLAVLAALFSTRVSLLVVGIGVLTTIVSMIAWILGVVTWTSTTCSAIVQTPNGPVNALISFGFRLHGQITALFNDLCRLSKILVGIEVFLWLTFIATSMMGIISYRRTVRSR